MNPVEIAVRACVNFLPVFLFLAALVFLDSYKLVKLSSIAVSLLMGVCAAFAALMVNKFILEFSSVDFALYRKYGAPVVEESCKALYLVYIIRRKNVGFMVDAAIHGFAVGAGFAFAENLYYMQSLGDVSLFVWVIRGFGTSIMHGGTAAIVAIVSKNLSDVKSNTSLRIFLPGFGLAVIVHSFFNHFFLSPLLSTLIVLLILPAVMVLVFDRSEQATRSWLGVGFDSDAELLAMVVDGNIADTKVGKYLDSLQNRFAGEVVADMLCYLRIYLELALQAKGILLLRQGGFDVKPDAEVKAKFEEMRYLEKSIGKTGLLALLPFLHVNNRDLWQLHMLQR